ncbi:MAG TPA: hypothetical protein VD905_17325 [Flavobacteriales bacterium]|nr:hypothetical protein [Flavobacteriales bacterium]
MNMHKTIDINELAESRYRWLNVNNKQVLYLDLKHCTEEEMVACSYLIHSKIVDCKSKNDIHLLINLNEKESSCRKPNFSALLDRLYSDKISKSAFIGINGYTVALARFFNLQNRNRVRLFDSYSESIAYLAHA